MALASVVFNILKKSGTRTESFPLEKTLDVLNDQRRKKHVDRQINLWLYRTRSQCRSSLNIIWEINSRRIRCEGHVARMGRGGEEINSYMCWIERPHCFGVEG
jgi:hypothetical protein